jgi:hypothetical protein
MKAQHRLGLAPSTLNFIAPEDEKEIDMMMGNTTETGTDFDPMKFLTP